MYISISGSKTGSLHPGHCSYGDAFWYISGQSLSSLPEMAQSDSLTVDREKSLDSYLCSQVARGLDNNSALVKVLRLLLGADAGLSRKKHS